MNEIDEEEGEKREYKHITHNITLQSYNKHLKLHTHTKVNK